MKQLKIGLLGLGQVGSGVYSILKSKGRALVQRHGLNFQIEQIAVRKPSKKRLVRAKRSELTTQARVLVQNPEIDVVIELIGGIHPAKELILTALRSGKDVITANKALLAEHGREIFHEAKRLGRHLFFEASVGGGIPVIKTIREGLIANRIHSVYSIINGTSNYILTKMTEEKLDFKEALRLAQAKGYAEANPKLDIEGIDAAHKLTILASLIFGGWVSFCDIYVRGIASIRSEDIAFAEEFGYVIKLLAIAKRSKDGIEAHVQPTLLSKSHVLSSVRNSYNAVFMKGDEVGDILLYGQGAGSRPTGSAVVSDLVDIAQMRESDHFFSPELKPIRVRSISSILSRYYLRFHVIDRPGVLAQISHVLGRHRISISDVIQKERRIGSVVPLILLTHETQEHSLVKAVKAINKLSVLKGKTQVLRIENGTN
jgi:homoserine dehydrogenase